MIYDRNEQLTSTAISDEQPSLEPQKMLIEAEVLALVPFKRATLYNMIKKGLFPRPVHISPNRVAWFASDIVRWQNALAEADPHFNPNRIRSKTRRATVTYYDLEKEKPAPR
ncbi:AlpA family phage regulatory protein [Bradyrhizobium sp. Ai1a-2]|uniref:helix-turn-helix transcriptional regulator n=1 Tax=Bradyrhizobium sp. Ai1a-2 TaxID=196490 RepID=UPI00040B04DE|nr:AlpA family phage regulatory protein [Bradyrhizobium sp. Ai1a-2]